MPATARNANKQVTLEVVGAVPKDTSSRQSKKPSDKPSSPSAKRKADQQPNKQISKRQKAHGDVEDDGESITINRAPVLELWASCVAQFLHPSLSWDTCLSVGGAI